MPFDQMLKKPAQMMGRSQQGMLGKGLGPSQPSMQKMKPPMQNAVQGAGQAIGQAFGRPQQPLQNMAQAGAGIGGAFGMGQRPMQMQAPPMMAPEPAPDQENTPEMMQAKQQQLSQMQQLFGAPGGMAGMFGQQLGGGEGMARPHVMPQLGRGAGPMPMPDESMDAQRVNKFKQMRPGIGPRFGMRQPQIRPEPMQQEEPQQY